MFKIDKSSVEFLDANRFLTILPPHEQTEDAARQLAAQHPDASDNASPKSPRHSEAAKQDLKEAPKKEASRKESSQKEAAVHAEDTSPEEVQKTTPEHVLELAKDEADRIRKDAETAAAKLLEDAKYESFCIINEASTQAEQIRIEAWQKGYSEGMELLNQQAETQKSEFEGFMRSILLQTDQFTQAVNAAFEENVLRLSFAIAKKIINIQLKNDDSIFEQLVKRTVQLHNEESRFFLRVSPSAYERYFQNGSDWLRASMECAPFKVVADATLPEYGILLETEEGLFKTGPDVQLGILKEALGVKGSADEAVL